MNNNNFTIISFYQFRQLNKLNLLKNFFAEFCSFHKLRGTILVAPEGINGSIAGLKNHIKLFEEKMLSKGFKNLEVKYSEFKYMPFNRLKIKIKKEIITFNSSLNLDVNKNTAVHLNYKSWNKIIKKKDTLIIDVRNEFENEIGTFKNALNPKTKNFSEFKNFVDKKLFLKNFNKIALFCTGGIRCEKASSYMKLKGFKNLYQLRGGILKYLKDTRKEESHWKGECFVFDNRVSIRNESKNGTYELCYACRMPVSYKERKSTKYQKGISCPKCYKNLSIERKRKLKERNKQIEISKKRGNYYPYIKYTTTSFF